MTDQSTILLIEDDPDQILMYETKFRLEKLKLIAARNGKEGLAAARRHHPHIILIDVMLGEDSGIDVLKNLKTNAATAKIPVIMFSNLDTKETREAAKKAGAIEYLLKTDLEPKELVGKIRLLLRS